MAEAPSAPVQESGWPTRWLQQTLGYKTRAPELFRAALTHRSASGPNNERLEFLGDAVLNLIIARRLYELFPGADEGDLSRLRARLVSSPPLAEVAARIRLGEELVLGGGELKTGGFRRESILADGLEAVIGAVFLDGGLASAEQIVLALFEPQIAALPAPQDLKDPKTRLQELLQGRGLPLPEYNLTSISGEPHEQNFSIRAIVRLPAGVRGLHIPSSREAAEIAAAGEGTSRRRAEQAAAQQLLERLAGPSS
jgi:ribonuclease III